MLATYYNNANGDNTIIKKNFLRLKYTINHLINKCTDLISGYTTNAFWTMDYNGPILNLKKAGSINKQSAILLSLCATAFKLNNNIKTKAT